MSKKSIAFIVVIALVLGIGLTYRLMMMGGADNTSSSAQIGGAFTLVNQDGKTVTDQDFRGKYMLVYFGYTFCPDVCPTELQAIGNAMDTMKSDVSAQVTPIFISIDPERDTVAQMKSFVPYFYDRMVGLTGSLDQVEQAAKAYRVYYKKSIPEGDPKDTDAYLMDHSSFVYLMGKDGKFIRHFNPGTSPENIAKGVSDAVAKNG